MSAPRGLTAHAVVDLGFGDSGKGLLTDFLTRRLGASVIVRFNGGAQAGHNVVTPDGRHHTFAQLGAGSFVPGVRTYLGPEVVVHPTALVREAEVLAAQGVPDPLARVAVSERALLVTPFHQAANRLRELARGAARHGTVGVGIGEAVHGALVDPANAPRAGDLREPKRLARKLGAVHERLRAEVAALPAPDAATAAAAARERWPFEEHGVAAAWLEQVAPLARNVAPEAELRRWLAGTRAVVFEGAQGLLLDETLGFHPWTTWSDCTPGGARRLLAEVAPEVELEVWGVLRAHAVRHGPGPLPTEDRALDGLVVEHNQGHPWQGRVRYGWFDGVLARYALALTPDLARLVVTHVDGLARRPSWWLGTGYEPITRADDLVVHNAAQSNRRLTALRHEPRPSLERQARLGALLATCIPVLEPVGADEPTYLAALVGALGRTIDGVSRGPRAVDVELVEL